MIFKFFSAYLLLLWGFLFSGCIHTYHNSSQKSTSNYQISNSPNWIYTRPSSNTFFIGIGSAKIDSNLNKAQQQAIRNALKDISEQVSVTITSHMRTTIAHSSTKAKAKNPSYYLEEIQTSSSMKIPLWNDCLLHYDSNGYVWAKISVSKEYYMDPLERSIDSVKKEVMKHIDFARNGTALYSIQQLFKALCILDSLPTQTPTMSTQCQTTELSQYLRKVCEDVLNNIKIKPRLRHGLKTHRYEDTCDITITFYGKPDTSLDFVWSSNDRSISLSPIIDSCGNTTSTYISGILSKENSSTIGIMPHFNGLVYELMRRKFNTPFYSFTIPWTDTHAYK